MELQVNEITLDRAIAPAIKSPVEFDIKLPPVEKTVLSNGIEVYSVNMGTEDTLLVNWVFYAGNWYETKKGIAAASNFLLKNGTSKRSAFEINEHFDYYGSYLNRACYNETSEITLHMLNKHADILLPVVAELIADSILPEEEMNIYKVNAQQRLKVSLQKSEFIAGRLIDAYLFGESHPYGKYNNLEDYAALQQAELFDFYKRYYREGRCLIFVSGKIPVTLIPQLELHFGKLPLRNHRERPDEPVHQLQPAEQKKSFVINDTDGVQAAIRIGRPFPGRQHPDFQKVLLLNNVFGGYFGSRLTNNIREDKGYTYGVYSYLLNHIGDSGWLISTEAGRDVSEATVKEIYTEMNLLSEELVDEEELEMTRNYMIGTILGDLDGPFQVASRWKSLILNNLDEHYFYRGIDLIKTTTAVELQQLAKKWLNPEDFYELVVV